MAGADATATEVGPVLDAATIELFPALRLLLDAVHSGAPSVSAGNLWGSSQALVLAALVERAQGPWLVVTSSDSDAETFLEDLSAIGVEGTWFPTREEGGGNFESYVELVRQRLQVAQQLAGSPDRRPRVLFEPAVERRR